jgi:hypothetical protein
METDRSQDRVHSLSVSPELTDINTGSLPSDSHFRRPRHKQAHARAAGSDADRSGDHSGTDWKEWDGPATSARDTPGSVMLGLLKLTRAGGTRLRSGVGRLAEAENNSSEP